jgi:hypothetical protein
VTEGEVGDEAHVDHVKVRRANRGGRPFTGTVEGNGLTLTLNEGLGSTTALVGTTNEGGFTMNFPAIGHALTRITFVPGTVADYNHAVLEIEGKAERGGSGSSSG